MNLALTYISIGFLLILIAVISTALKKLPLTAAIIYLFMGFLFGEACASVIHLNFSTDTSLLKIATEIVVIISLFTAGLKLRAPLHFREWRVPALLASVSMLLTILLFSTVAKYFLNFSWDASLLLAAILAPTDPVLASSVQVTGPEDKSRLRFSLTGEAGLNDGTAFPIVMLALGLMKKHELGDFVARWLAIDVIWGIAGGLFIGTFVASRVWEMIRFLRAKYQESESLDDFLSLGLIAMIYGIAVFLHTYGFLAVFAAGLALRRSERDDSNRIDLTSKNQSQTRTDTISGHMTGAILKFNEHLERVGEMLIVVLIGSMFSFKLFRWPDLFLACALMMIIRPIAVYLTIPKRLHSHRLLISWFGIRGVGSLYYLAFVIDSGISNALAERITAVTLLTVVLSIMIYGISGAPLMLRYSRQKYKRLGQ